MKRKLYCRDMTVAKIRYRQGADSVDIIFLESARIYRLLKKNRDHSSILKKLEDASLNAGLIKVCFESIESEIIEEVR